MAKNVVWATVFIVIAAILQSTILSRIAIFNAVPDLALCILVFTAYVNGTMTGQLTGFFSGILLDFLSAAPLGLNAFIRTITGALTGMFKGTFFLDALFLPMGLCAAATIFKALMIFILHLLFAGAIPSYSITGPTFWIELLLNTVLSIPLFALLKLFRPILVEGRET
ncbi:rod shape-determining protein MreD [Breznakiella homolactica]|uniref:Rod shape-determining protein MreD n=1 Tax=Breznakiella homolactica TaxID=2798577 RepID=A0A7T7XKN1_9SPIR|nr:rod shape-determining protein MreD [Breznakiella homolactica]QQO08159.1 rod shape-determining protein MreD [Breznakiella homolactica]